MRKVKIFEMKKVAGNGLSTFPTYKKVLIGKGYLLTWGLIYEDVMDGITHYSSAVVEMADGSVKCVPAEMIQFINPTKEDQ